MSRRAGRLLVVVFLAAIGLPLALNIAGRDGADAEAENRPLAAFPDFNGSWRSAATAPSRLADWFDDHFGLRATLIQWYGETRLFWLGVSPAPSVALGADGWLFYADDSGLEDYAQDRPLPEGEKRNWHDAVVRARDWVRARGGAFVFTVAPDKHVIYPDEFPTTVRRTSPTSRTDDVLGAVADTGVAVDLRPALLRARTRERLYQLTDTHWNDRGAFVAYQQIIEAVRVQNPQVPPAWPRSDFDDVTRSVHGMDLAGMIGLTRVLREDDLQLVPKRPRRAVVVEPAGEPATAEVGKIVTEIPGSSLPRAIIFRDSFASNLAPFLSEHFSRAVYLWQNDFLPDDVERERADVVIQEIVGRHLYSFIPSPELVPSPDHRP